MDFQVDSITGIPSVYNNMNNMGGNPTALLFLTVMIVVFYLVFASLGVGMGPSEGTQSKGGGAAFIEVVLWSMFILLIMLNGVHYFFDMDVKASLRNVFSQDPEIDIEIDSNQQHTAPIPEIMTEKQVFHVPGNNYTYDNAAAVCKAYDADLASYNQIENAYKSGAEWCSYGWSKDQMAFFPTQKDTYKKLKEKPGHENMCGRPGINGGYIKNPNARFGVNCYGYKPEINKLEQKLMDSSSIVPETMEDIDFERKVRYFRSQLPSIVVSPFSQGKWSRV